MDNKHCNFRGKVSEEIYANLESMYQVIEGQDITEELKNNLKIDKLTIDEDIRLKVSIYYLRWCEFINNVIENDAINKDNIAYYLQCNSLVEMKHLGLGYYFDVKYPKQKIATLYSVGYGEDSTWKEFLKNNNIESNQIKENGIQLIFRACKEHINCGGNYSLKSLSKCFGVDLFKYMKLDNNGNANLYIIKNTLVNFIKINEKSFSVQDYLVSDEIFDESVQFCIDFTNVRGNKAENYNSWSKRFLCENEFISIKELNDKKEEYEIREDTYDDIILSMLQSDRKEKGERSIGSRVSPITDREVIVSDQLWGSEEIEDKIDNTVMKDEQCYHFTFTENEYVALIYFYFMKYAEEKNNKKECYENNSKKRLEEIGKIIKKINGLITEKEDEDSEETSGEIEKLKLMKVRSEEIEKKFDSAIQLINNIPQNIQTVLNTINWDNEEIPKHWSLDNIYQAKNQEDTKNLICNIIKCLCKDLSMK